MASLHTMLVKILTELVSVLTLWKVLSFPLTSLFHIQQAPWGALLL